MLNKISLSVKLSLVAAFPFFGYLIMLGLKLQENHDALAKAEHTMNAVEVYAAASAAVHEIQKERARTVGFMGGSVTESELGAQRTSVDEKIGLWKKKAGIFSKEFESATMSVEGLAELRNKVNSKQIEKKDAIAYYTSTNANFLFGEFSLASQAQIAGIPLVIAQITGIESAKESAGRLRAITIEVINADEPLTKMQHQTIGHLKDGVDISLDEASISLSAEAKANIKKFKSSQNWVATSEKVEAILKNSDKGHYGLDAKTFYSHITAAIDDLAVIISGEIEGTKNFIGKAHDKAYADLRMGIILAGSSSLGLLVFLMYLIRSITSSIALSILNLKQNSDSVATAAERLASASQELSSSSTETGASMQKTVIALDEVLSMTERNSESAKKSKNLSNDSTVAVKEGKQVVDMMISSIEDISNSTKGISEAVEASNREISEIVRVIGDIGEKTKVINDIVFQTKLLSFNASVEAARAGEHGKGFSVVAEEVGNLAQMSGNAAKEISGMLDASMQRVENIVTQTKSNVGRLVEETKEKVDTGTATAQSCGESLDKILISVEELNAMVGEIAQASTEQTTGISEINTSMNQMDQAGQQNNIIANQCSEAAAGLSAQSEGLVAIIGQLHDLLHGKSNQSKKVAKGGRREEVSFPTSEEFPRETA